MDLFADIDLSFLVIVGAVAVLGFYLGNSMKYIKMPRIIGYMFLGVILGPSIINFLSDSTQETLSFITEIALGFVALSIGLELSFTSLRKLGSGILLIIFFESFAAFAIVTLAIWAITGDMALSVIIGAVAPASAPAGTVAVIQEFKAKGSLTKALYAIVGFDDGLAIIIFGFASSFVMHLLLMEAGATGDSFWSTLTTPLIEIGGSLVAGVVIGGIFCLLARKLSSPPDLLVLIFGFVLFTTGISDMLHLSLILTNMVAGIMVVNTQPHAIVQKLHDRLPGIMPLLFILFFTLAGANLHLSALPSLGLLGTVYIIARMIGLIGGSWLGAVLGRTEEKIRKYVGLGILNQAGVAIGLSLIIKHDYKGVGKVMEVVNGVEITRGDKIGSIIITSITATSILFGIIGPILTKYSLKKAGEIKVD